MASKTVVLAFFNDEPTADDAVEALKKWDKGGRPRQARCDRRPRPRRQGQDQDPQAGQAQRRQGCRDRPRAGGHRPADPARRRDRRRASGRLPSQGPRPQGRGPRADRVPSSLPVRPRWACSSNPAIAIDVSAKLTELGGTAEVHEVTEEAVAEVETAVPAVEAAEIAAGDDLSILDGVGPKYADALKASGVTTFAQLSRDDRRGHRREAERGERATDRRPQRPPRGRARRRSHPARTGRRCVATSTPPRRWPPADRSRRHRGHKCIHDAPDHPGRGRLDSAPNRVHGCGRGRDGSERDARAGSSPAGSAC